MFKDLRSVLLKENKDLKNIIEMKNASIDVQIACNILEMLCWHVGESLRKDRSTVKLNMFEKGIISSGLNSVMPGTKKYIAGMSAESISLLLDDIEIELSKRRKETKKK